MLLHAWRGESLSTVALQLMDDDTCQFCSSQMTRLELMPKPTFEKRKTEVEFYHTHFADCESIHPLSEELGGNAEKLASRYGLTGSDALQIAAAIAQGAKEFYTSEKPGKPMFRVKELKVISLFSL